MRIPTRGPQTMFLCSLRCEILVLLTMQCNLSFESLQFPLCNLYNAICTGQSLQCNLRREIFALQCGLQARLKTFALHSFVCDLCLAIFALHFFCKTGFAIFEIFAMQSLLCYICFAIFAMCAVCYAIFALQSLQCKLCCKPLPWKLCNLCYAIVALQF